MPEIKITEGIVLVKKIVNVPVATLWTSPEAPRPLDEPVLGNPIELDAWLEKMTYEERLALCDDNLVQSQALYGTAVEVLEEKGDWAEVIILDQPSKKDGRGYPGWMPRKQLQESDLMESTGPVAVVNQPKAFLYDASGKKVLEISYQTRLPLVEENETWVKVKTPDGTGNLKRADVILERPNERKSISGADIIQSGEQFLGLPYLWGGMSGFGYDCSGFAYMMHRSVGLIIPRDAGDQAHSGKWVEADERVPGDLMFFAYEKGKGALHHVAIYYGDGKMMHAPNTGKSVEIISMAGTIYEEEYWGARRYW
ncbi:MAG TPA: C40 family peptidase [Bacillales bacterium]|nr:C40 family peptidase [Bacillales bacterium]